MKRNILPLLILPLFICSSCNSKEESASKYGGNKFVTENGTTYVNDENNYNTGLYLIMLKADGTGSASGHKESNPFSYEFNYIIEDEINLYFPRRTGGAYCFTFSISEDGKRQMKEYFQTFTEFYIKDNYRDV